MVATPGTFPAYPPYQPGALAWTGQEIGLLVTDAQATAAATYRFLLVDQVGKAPSVMSHGVPSAQDLISVYRPSSGLYFSASVSEFAVIANHTVPPDGQTNQILAKNSSTDFDYGWINVSQVVAVDGTTIANSGSQTNLSLSVAAGGIGSTQLGPFAVQNGNIALNAVGNAQIRQSVGVSVVGNAGTALANVADIVASAPNQVLQVNAGGTGLVWTLPLQSAPFNTASLATAGVLYGNGSATVGVTSSGTTGLPLIANGTLVAPAFAVLGVIGGGVGTNTIKQNAIVYGNGTSTVGMLSGGTTGLSLISNGTTQLPSFQALSLASTNVAGVLAMVNGGLGTTSLNAFGPLIGAGTSTPISGTAGTNGQVFLGQGATNNPTFKSIIQDLSIASTGTATVLGIQSFGVVSTAPSTSQYLQWSGSAWTPASAVLISPTTLATALVTTVSLNITASFFDVLSIAQGTVGTWWCFASCAVGNGGTADVYRMKLWDGSTVVCSSDNFQGGFSLGGFLSNPVGNIKLSVEDITTNTGQVLANASGAGKDTTISVMRVG